MSRPLRKRWNSKSMATKYALILFIGWTACIVGLGLWGARHEIHDARELMRNEARAHFLKDQAFRFWAAKHGGVYVPPTVDTPPNPHLSHLPDRDVVTDSDKKLTLMNPAYMVRQLMEEYDELYGVKGRITSLKPLRSENIPDPWERKALSSFERGVTEVEETVMIGDESYMRLMRPMVTKKTCMKCHGHQGYREGDIRGGVGVSVPAAPFLTQADEHIRERSYVLGMIWMIGSIGIGLGVYQLREETDKRDTAEATLKKREKRYRTLVENTKAIVWELDVETQKFTYMAPRVAEVTGYPSELWTDINFWASTIHPADRDRSVKFCIAETAKGRDHVFDYRIIAADGTIRHIRDMVSVVKDGDAPIALSGILIDLTDRRQAEMALRESEERFRFLFESMGSVFVHPIRPDGQPANFEQVNLTACETLGYTEEELLAMSPFELDDPDVKDEYIPTAMCQLRENGRAVFDAVHVAKDGHKVPVEITANVMEMDGRQMIISVAQDLTERRQAEEERHRLEKDYQTLFREMLNGIALHEVVCNDAGEPVDYRFLAVNPSFEQMTGLKAEEIIGKTVLEVLPGTEPHWIKTYGRIALGGEPVFVENYAEDLDKYFEVAAFQSRHGQFVCSFSDITKRKQSEKKLSAINARLQALWQISSLEDADAKTLSKHISSTLTEMTGSAYGFYGFVNEDETEMTILSWCGDAMDDCAMADKPVQYSVCDAGIWAEAIRQRKPLVLNDYSADHSAKKGLPVGHVELTNLLVVPHFLHGKIISVAAVANRQEAYEQDDIAQVDSFLTSIQAILDRTKLRSQLERAQKMEAIGTLAGGIAHDFNNILAAIIGYSELALGKGDGANAKELAVILEAGERAKDLVTQILAFSRKLEPKLEAIDLNVSVKQTAKMLERTIPKMVEIQCDLADDLWSISADVSQVSQVLMNLAVNANDAMPEGGRFVLKTENIVLDRKFCSRFSTLSPGKYVQLTATDTGHGMSCETVKKIFDPFFTQKEVGKGTGLGLAMVYGIVQSHRGMITCYSELGHGTCFKIYLPKSDPVAELEEREEHTIDNIQRGTETVLLVDDEEILRGLGREMLVTNGYEVITAESGEEALKIYNEKGSQIDLVILDISMPGMGGHKCLEELLEIDADIKVVIASGYARNGHLNDTLGAGAVGFIPKPFAMNEMLKQVRDALQR